MSVVSLLAFRSKIDLASSRVATPREKHTQRHRQAEIGGIAAGLTCADAARFRAQPGRVRIEVDSFTSCPGLSWAAAFTASNSGNHPALVNHVLRPPFLDFILPDDKHPTRSLLVPDVTCLGHDFRHRQRRWLRQTWTMAPRQNDSDES